MTKTNALTEMPSIGALQQHLWKVLIALDADEVSPSKANATANVSGKLLKSVTAIMDYQRLTGQVHAIDLMEHT